jgi:hypothetical protein
MDVYRGGDTPCQNGNSNFPTSPLVFPVTYSLCQNVFMSALVYIMLRVDIYEYICRNLWSPGNTDSRHQRQICLVEIPVDIYLPCMYVCMYVCVCVCVCVCVWVHACIYVCMYVCMCVYIYMYVSVCLSTYITTRCWWLDWFAG